MIVLPTEDKVRFILEIDGSLSSHSSYYNSVESQVFVEEIYRFGILQVKSTGSSTYRCNVCAVDLQLRYDDFINPPLQKACHLRASFVRHRIAQVAVGGSKQAEWLPWSSKCDTQIVQASAMDDMVAVKFWTC